MAVPILAHCQGELLELKTCNTFIDTAAPSSPTPQSGPNRPFERRGEAFPRDKTPGRVRVTCFGCSRACLHNRNVSRLVTSKHLEHRRYPDSRG